MKREWSIDYNSLFLKRMGIPMDDKPLLPPPPKKYGKHSHEIHRITWDVAGQGWVRDALFDWLKAHKVKEACTLHRDNQYEGQFHRRYQNAFGDTFDLLANVYDGLSFEPLIAWVVIQKHKHNET